MSKAPVNEKNYCLNYTMSGEGVRDMDPKEAELHASDLNLIDVRRPEEFTGELGHIAGAKLVTLETEFQKFLTNSTDEQKNKATLFICRSGGRSTRAALLALQAGFKDVYNMAGGMIYWNELELKTEK